MIIQDWGMIPYSEALNRQMQLVEEVACEKKQETLVFCTHPPVVTVGRGTQQTDVFGWGGELVEVSRGGRATYHGPNQIIVYPIINLQKAHINFPAKDLRGYTRALENAIIFSLCEFGVEAQAREFKFSENVPSMTGVWVGEKKIASIGFAVRKWITYHGLALNVLHDPLAFQGINPCGFKSHIMCSLESVAPRPLNKAANTPTSAPVVERDKVQVVLRDKLLRYLAI